MSEEANMPFPAERWPSGENGVYEDYLDSRPSSMSALAS